jgi:PAS domain S-box-containing protein
MKKQTAVKETRDALVEDLRARLAEAEETLRSIRSGEVDALVVSTARGNQVFTLTGAERIYRLLIETMNEGALTLSPDGTILYCNGCFAALLKRPLEKIVGTSLHDYSTPSEQPTLDALLRRGQIENSRGETWLRAADGSLIPVNLSVSALHEDETRDNLAAVIVTNLTEQKRNEAIVAAEKLARSILDQAAEAILVCDGTGRITHASQAARRLCEQEPLLQAFGAAFSLQLKDGTPFSLAAPLRGETLQGVQARLEWDGRACDVLVSAGPLRSRPDHISGCIVTLTDISARMAMEQALQAKNEELQSQAEELQSQAEELRRGHDLIARLLETSPAGIMRVNRAGQITFANARAEQVLGLTAGEALGRAYNAPAWHITDYAGQPFPDEQLPVSQVLATGQPVYDVRHAIQWPDGRRVLLSISAAPLFDSSGQVDGVVTAAEDVTERVRAAEIVQESERRLRAIIDSAPEAMLVADERGEVVLANPAAERLFAGPVLGAAGLERLRQIIRYYPNHTPVGPRDLPTFRAAVRGETLREVPMALFGPGGEWRDVLANAVPILDEHGQCHGAVAVYRDITERLKAEQALRVALEKYRVLIESFPLGITISDATGQVVESNKEGERLLGVSPAEHTRRHIAGPEWRLIRPDGSPMPAEEYASVRALREKRLIDNVEMGIVKEDGDITWLNVTAAPIPLEGYGAAVAFGDITARKRAESQREAALAALRDSEERYRALFNGMTEGFALHEVICDEQGQPIDYRFLEINPSFERLTGLKRADVVGQLKSVVLPNDDPHWLEIYGTVALTGQPVHFENHSAALGRYYEVYAYCPMPRQFAVLLMDITDRVQTVETLRETRDYLNNLLTYANAPIIVWDPNFQITRFNGAFEHLTGLKAADVLGRNLNILFPEDRQAEAMTTIRRAAAGERLETVEIPILGADGTVHTVLWNSATVYAADGVTPVATIAQGQDITVRVQAESQREAALARLKASLAEKEVLMREIYHRVKNNVQALIYLMDMQADYILDEATRQMLHELRGRAHAMALVHEKLYQSQNLARIDFGDYLYDLVDNLSHAFGMGRSIVWRIDVEDVALSVDTAIPCGLIVSELLTNALKYAFPGGRPYPERGETDCTISVASRVEGHQITLAVSDNGVGLPAGVDWATTKTLGLQLVNILACHQLGGQVEVDRSAGTSFKITFAERMKN